MNDSLLVTVVHGLNDLTELHHGNLLVHATVLDQVLCEGGRGEGGGGG